MEKLLVPHFTIDSTSTENSGFTVHARIKKSSEQLLGTPRKTYSRTGINFDPVFLQKGDIN
jgi:hypothetical protein